jgi:pyruvate dehydrogenase E1 component beta subunit
VTFGKIYHRVARAADQLSKEGIDVEIVDLRTVRPIDYATVIDSVKKTSRLVIVEEAWPLASISTEIAYKIQREAFDYLDAPIQRVTMRDVPMSYAANLVEATLPNETRIIKAVKSVCYES